MSSYSAIFVFPGIPVSIKPIPKSSLIEVKLHPSSLMLPVIAGCLGVMFSRDLSVQPPYAVLSSRPPTCSDE